MAEVVSGEAVVIDVPVARFPSRVLALLIDVMIQLGFLYALYVILLAAQVDFDKASQLAIAVVIVVLTYVGYPTIFETLTRGRSPGKMALGLRVVSDDGGPERFRQALVRGLASLVEFWIFLGSPALISSLLSANGKRLGDLFAGTFVLQERLPRRQGLPPMLAAVPPPLIGWAQTLQLSALSDQTAEQAASYLRRYSELRPAARDQLGQQIAAAVAAQITPPPPPGTPVAPFLTAVLAVRRHRDMARLAAQRGWAAQASPAAYPGASAQQAAAQPGPFAQTGPFIQAGPFAQPAPQPAPYVQPPPFAQPAAQPQPDGSGQPAGYQNWAAQAPAPPGQPPGGAPQSPAKPGGFTPPA